MDTNDFSYRLKEAMNLRGMKQIELAEKTGISRGALSSYISGRWKAKQNNIYKLAYALNVSPAWLLGYDVPMEQKQNDIPLPDGTFRPALKRVPMLGYAAAGEPLENLDGQDTYYVETDSKYRVDFCITVRGDSMINAGINDGDIVFVRRQPEVENGQVACVEIERSKVCIKRFYKTDNGVTLVSENPKYAPLQFNETNCDDFRILGLAVIKQSEIK